MTFLWTSDVKGSNMTIVYHLKNTWKSFAKFNVSLKDPTLLTKLTMHLFSKIRIYSTFLMYSIAGVLRGATNRRPYQELSRDSLHIYCCFRKLCAFHKFYKNKSPQYLFNSIQDGGEQKGPPYKIFPCNFYKRGN